MNPHIKQLRDYHILQTTTALSSYKGTNTAAYTQSDGCYWKRDSAATGPTDGYFTLPCASGGWWKLYVPGNIVDVKQHGKAAGTGDVDDSAAIQRCIDYARSLSAGGGGVFRASITFPAGFYYLTKTLDCTNTNGITLIGPSGIYITAGFIGNTVRTGSGAMMVDFSGSSFSGAESLGFYSYAGYGTTRSTIGIMFGLTANGGLRTFTRNVYMKLEDSSTANNGLGTIGVVSIRAEESQYDGTFSASLPMLLTNNPNIADTGRNLTFVSPFASLSTGYGSEGVINLTGSLIAYEKRSPALILNGANAVRSHQYIGAEKAGTSWLGTEETAVLMCQATYTPELTGTYECYSRIFKASNIVQGARINVNSANVVSPATELIDVTGAFIRQSVIEVTVTNPGERANSTLLYHAPGDGDTQVAGSLSNSTISCYQIVDNRLAISKGLLHNTENTKFHTSQPFERVGGVIRALFQNKVAAGSATNIVPATVMRFLQADKATPGNNNGGYYSAYVEGFIIAGGYGSGGRSVLRFRASITQNQDLNGNKSAATSTVTALEKSETNGLYVTVSGLTISLAYASGVGSVIITPMAMGAAEGLTVQLTRFELMADFGVNHPCIFA